MKDDGLFRVVPISCHCALWERISMWAISCAALRWALCRRTHSTLFSLPLALGSLHFELVLLHADQFSVGLDRDRDDVAVRLAEVGSDEVLGHRRSGSRQCGRRPG